MELPVSCDQITWPDLSALQELELIISGETNWRLNTLLHHLSLKSLIVAPPSSTLVYDYVDCLAIGGRRWCPLSTLVYEDCVAIGDHVTSKTSLNKLCISSYISDKKGVEAITAALASNQSLPLERLALECECTFTATAGDSLAQFITNTTTLKYLLKKNGSLSRVETITAALASNQSLPLERLALECECTFTATAGDSLAQFITNTTTLKYLLKKNGSLSRVETITAALASNQSLPLERLKLECECTFTATAGDSLAQFITHTTTLKYLSIKWCSLSAHALLVLTRAIHQNSILQTKYVEGFRLTVNGGNEAKDLAQLLVEYPDLIVNLSNNSISDAGAVALAQALHHNSTLTDLNLSNNSISGAGAVALAQALHHNSTLTDLNLSHNSISGAGAVALAQALHHNSTLTDLNLSHNSISGAGAVALAQALHHNSTLTELDLSNNSIGDAGAAALAQALHHNSTLTKLFLSNNSIIDAGAVVLAQALHRNSTLTELHLCNNSISDTGVEAFAVALHHNSTLTWLYLHSNGGICKEGTRLLVQALTVNTSIRKWPYGGLCLPKRCEKYAKQCPQYHTLGKRVQFM